MFANALRHWLVAHPPAPVVRPWGLAVPVLVLLVCLPLLRPLRHPTDISDNEKARLATVQAIVEQHTLRIDQTSFADTAERVRPARPHDPAEVYARQSPALAAILAGPYWVMHRLGLSFDENPTLSVYLLTLLGSTLPVAAVAGMAYRLGRVFELRRPWRALLAGACVFGTGLVAYGTVLNAHAPAAALMLAAVAAVVHATITPSRGNAHAFLMLAGFCAALAGVIDLGAMILLALLAAVPLTLRWPARSRAAGLALYALGAAAPLALYAALTVPVTGDLRPGFLHPELAAAAGRPASAAVASEGSAAAGTASAGTASAGTASAGTASAGTASAAASAAARPAVSDEFDEDPSPTLSRAAWRFADGVLGPHGLLSHFPVIVLGVGGIGMVLHRHWPGTTKALAVACLAAACAVVVAYVAMQADWQQPMFATRWFIAFLPLVMIWGGAYLRRRHHPAAWAGAGALLAFSVLTTLIGATNPFTRTPPGQHTAYAAVRQLLASPPAHSLAVTAPPPRPGRRQ